MAFHEHHGRSLAKTITYRILIVVSNSVVVFALTRNLDTTLNVTGITTVVSTIIYFFHERAWNHVHWGKAHLKSPVK